MPTTFEEKLSYYGVPVRESYNPDECPVIAVLRREDVSFRRVSALVLLMGGKVVGQALTAWVVLPADRDEDRAWYTREAAMIHWLQVRGVEL